MSCRSLRRHTNCELVEKLIKSLIYCLEIDFIPQYSIPQAQYTFQAIFQYSIHFVEGVFDHIIASLLDEQYSTRGNLSMCVKIQRKCLINGEGAQAIDISFCLGST